jgi:nucleoside diphosphate kinase
LTEEDASICSRLSLPEWLSCFPEKLKYYKADNDFLEGWASLTNLERQGLFSLERLWTLGSVLFKADTMLRGNGLRGISFLEEHGFQIRAVRAVSFSGERVDHLWRYSLGRLSNERVELLKRLQAISPSLYLIVEAAGNGSRLPCSLRVTELKGQVALDQRDERTIRYAMGEPQSAFFNFVHTADEPSDLVRELGLLFDRTERNRLIQEAVSGSKPDAEGVYKALMARCSHSRLDFSGSIQKLRERVGSANVLSDGERADLSAAANRLRHTGYGSWLRLRHRLLTRGVRIDEIDEIIIAANLIPLKQLRPVQPFPSCEARHWENHNPLRKNG